MVVVPRETTNPFDRLQRWLGWKIARHACELDDLWINPAIDQNLSWEATPRLQVFAFELDSLHLRERGWYYAQKLSQSGWSGHQKVIDFQGEDHVFRTKNLTSQNSTIRRNRIAAFINQD